MLFYNVFLTLTVFVIFIISLFIKKRKIPRYVIHSLTKEQIYPFNNSDDTLFEFLSENRFALSDKCQDYLVDFKGFSCFRKNKLKKTWNSSIYLLVYCLKKSELFDLLRLNYICFLSVLRQKNLVYINKLTLLKLLFEYHVWTVIHLEGPMVFITTQSSLQKLPIAFYLGRKEINRQMFWYSTNNRPIAKNNEKANALKNSEELSTYIDAHLVWNNVEAEFLKNDGIANVKIVGSILFYPKTFERSFHDGKVVSYFDVTPFSDFQGFMSESMLLKNLLGICESTKILNVENSSNISLFLKPKRKYLKHHSRKYIQIIRRLNNIHELEILPQKSNLYDVIYNSDLVIAVPFSSPAVIAEELGVKSAFVCLSPENYNLINGYAGIPLITTNRQLIDFLKS